MLHPLTWRQHPWMSQQAAQSRSVSSHPWNHLSPMPGKVPAARSSPIWRASLPPHTQDFVVPSTSSAAVHGPATSELSISSQLDSSHNVNETLRMQDELDLARLPFFRSQVLKLEKEVAEGDNPQQQETDNKITTEPIGDTIVACSTPSYLHDSETALTPVGTNLSQAATFADGRKRKFDCMDTETRSRGPPLVKVHIQSLSHPRAFEARLPYLIEGENVQQLPALVTPANPHLMQVTLQRMESMIVYAQFDCDDRCRSRGICVHFSFLLGCRRVHDGLICPRCRGSQIERPYSAQRICPKHNKRTLSQFAPNLPEDLLASDAQIERANEIFLRSWFCDWDGVPQKAENANTIGLNTRSNYIHDFGQAVLVEKRTADIDLAIPSFDNQYQECGIESERHRARTCTEVDPYRYDKVSHQEGTDTRGRVHEVNCGSYDGRAYTSHRYHCL